MKASKQSTIDLVRRADQRLRELMDKGLKDLAITSRQYHVMAAVNRMNHPSQTDLVAATGIDRSTLADVVRRLKNKGLIQRRRSTHDARAYVVRLSDEGKRLLAAGRPAFDRTEELVSKGPLRESLARVVAQVGA